MISRATLVALAPVAFLTVLSPTLAAQQSLPLDEAVRRALLTHPAVSAAEARAEGAEARAGVVRSAWFPELSLSATGTRFEEPMLVSPLHGFDFTVEPEFDNTLYRGNLDLSWTLFEGGGRSARVRGAEARYGAVAARAEAARQDLAVDVVGTYASLLSLRAGHEAQRTRLEALRAERDRVNRFLAEGQAPEVERFRAEASIARARAELAELEAGIQARTHQLARLVGMSQDGLDAGMLRPVALITPDPNRAVQIQDTVETLPAIPELAAARSAVKAAEADRSAASADWFPRLFVAGGLRSYGGSNVDVTTEWQAGLGLEYPIFNGFARSRRVAEASAAESAARADLKSTRLAVADRADRALEAVRGAAISAEALEVAERHLVEVVRIEKLSLSEGVGLQTDYLRAEAELAETRAARARAVNLHVIARAELARARGELTLEWVRDNLENLP